ncbi:MAG: hypothetical protein Q7U38_12385 [Methylobacter sp.]|nr:hypothetical protein [Methylobacter sp.]MDP2098434.1 hypothetical protein [Methylobacter sp.]MDP2427481.1 hypothetical protein [Methylobacter sp.]MDP3055065.1 hypothetical protein [Methylobacter sp.]MDP3361446.1 hypothetical protein [Methylobacter sp.]
MKSAQTPTVFSRDELLVLITALSSTDHLASGTFDEKLSIQNELLERFSQLLQSDDACRRLATLSDVVEQGGN